MKTIIYYFTGTGNSLAAARKIANVLGETELVPIASLQDTKGDIVPKADRVGIVCPVYDAGIPLIVAEFARRLDISRSGYTFAVVTLGRIGVSALHQLNGIFAETRGRKIDAAFAVPMPGNFPPVGKIALQEKQDRILASANSRLEEIARIIDTGLEVHPGISPVSALMKFITYNSFAQNGHTLDREFSVSDACTSCGTCVKVCPVKNIMMVNDRPSWLHHCELCCACLHFCPAEAIQLNMLQGTKGRGRYRHPDLKIADMKAQRGEVPDEES
jgi:ferredoxin/flavodoxin